MDRMVERSQCLFTRMLQWLAARAAAWLCRVYTAWHSLSPVNPIRPRRMTRWMETAGPGGETSCNESSGKSEHVSALSPIPTITFLFRMITSVDRFHWHACSSRSSFCSGSPEIIEDQGKAGKSLFWRTQAKGQCSSSIHLTVAVLFWTQLMKTLKVNNHKTWAINTTNSHTGVSVSNVVISSQC